MTRSIESFDEGFHSGVAAGRKAEREEILSMLRNMAQDEALEDEGCDGEAMGIAFDRAADAVRMRGWVRRSLRSPAPSEGSGDG